MSSIAKSLGISTLACLRIMRISRLYMCVTVTVINLWLFIPKCHFKRTISKWLPSIIFRLMFLKGELVIFFSFHVNFIIYNYLINFIVHLAMFRLDWSFINGVISRICIVLFNFQTRTQRIYNQYHVWWICYKNKGVTHEMILSIIDTFFECVRHCRLHDAHGNRSFRLLRPSIIVGRNMTSLSSN